jgi:hypothetical protein
MRMRGLEPPRGSRRGGGDSGEVARTGLNTGIAADSLARARIASTSIFEVVWAQIGRRLGSGQAGFRACGMGRRARVTVTREGKLS